MNVIDTGLKDAFVIEPTVHSDERGHFYEGFNRQEFARETGYDFDVFQTNHSQSDHQVLRWLHYQVTNVQAKLVWANFGEIYDVIVDLRRSSQSFGRWYGTTLSTENKKRLLVPEGFAHGFLVTSQRADITYLTSNSYNPQAERFLNWNCPELGIKWPTNEPILNERDARAPTFGDCETFK